MSAEIVTAIIVDTVDDAWSPVWDGWDAAAVPATTLCTPMPPEPWDGPYSDAFSLTEDPCPEAVLPHDNEEEVAAIIGHRRLRTGLRLLTAWKGDAKATTEPLDSFVDVATGTWTEACANYLCEHGLEAYAGHLPPLPAKPTCTETKCSNIWCGAAVTLEAGEAITVCPVCRKTLVHSGHCEETPPPLAPQKKRRRLSSRHKRCVKRRNEDPSVHFYQ